MESADLLIMVLVIQALFIATRQELIPSDRNSICRETKSRTVLRYVPYLETYRRKIIFWKTSTRYNYRWENQTEWYTEESCCAGYREDNNICEPVCRGGCIHGFCTRPEQCSCDVGYKLVSSASGQICLPHCYYCQNGLCTAPNVCKCNAGYEESFMKLGCQPTCHPGCPLHSRCREINKCVCDSGYRMVSFSNKSSTDSLDMICEAICEPQCNENSVCSSPNYCVCKSGYERVVIDGSRSTSECQATCYPPCGEHSTCVAPNKCECHSGYAPSKVIQDIGEFTPFSHSINQCDPVCNPPCGKYGICQSPNNCTCESGYRPVLERDKRTSEVLSVTCEVECNPPCGIRGDCIAPNTCSCEAGWQLEKRVGANFTEKYCVPHCDPACGNFAICKEPDKCECHSGYKEVPSDISNVTHCEPICTKACNHGTCEYPDICKCDSGYILDTDDPFNCEPQCGPNGCLGGVCTAPNQCTCLEGFEKTKGDQCTPSCDLRCQNGTCVSPNNCTCSSGFVIDESTNSSSMCVPYCQSGCPNGTCTSPEICDCDDGFKKNENNECKPNCNGRCDFGDCFAPGQCSCNPGYVEVPEPEGPMCQPSCQDGCSNGQCTAPNSCSCDQGFILDKFNSSLCNPVCEGGCGQGECVGPNDCVCNEGFVRLNDSIGQCVDPCDGRCGLHEICVAENRTCNCSVGWDGQECDIPTLCRISHGDMDENLIQWIADSNGTNDTIGSFDAVNWQGPTCSRTCILNHSNATNECFRLPSEKKGYENVTVIICSINAALSCNAVAVQLGHPDRPGIPWMLVLIIGITGTAAVMVIFLFTIKRRQQDSVVISANRDNLFGQPDIENSLLHEDDSAYL